MVQFQVKTPREGFIDITHQVAAAVQDAALQEGLCHVFVRHTTAAVTINENADPDVQHDLLLAIDDIFKDRQDFRHSEGNSAAHLKSSVIGASETVPVSDGRLQLGTWQGIYLAEFDGPRTRTVTVTVLGEEKVRDEKKYL